MSIPFIGKKAVVNSNNECQYPFGYIFGSQRYFGGDDTWQYYIDGMSVERNEYYIPTSLKKVTVTGSNIPRYAFDHCSNITSIIISDQMIRIDSDAFSGCSGLDSVYITDIDMWCMISFGNGNANPLTFAHKLYLNGELLTNLVISDNVWQIGAYAFCGCSSLTNITIPDSVRSIGYSAFSGCSVLTEMTIPFVGGSIKATSDTYQYPFGYIFGGSSYAGGIETRQCYYVSSTSSTINTFYIPASLRKVSIKGGNILYGAFYNCSNLTSIAIPDGIISIGDDAFFNCSSLNSMIIPEGVKSIGDFAFSCCKQLRSISIPDSMTDIGIGAFSHCSFTSIIIPYGVTSIGECAINRERDTRKTPKITQKSLQMIV